MSTTNHKQSPTSGAAPVLPQEAARGRRSSILRGQPVAAVLFDLDGTLVETDDQTVARLARRLAPLRPLLPQRDVQRAARHLAGWINDHFNIGLAVLDWLKLDEPAQGLARHWGLISENSLGQPLLPVAGTVELVQALYGHYLLGIVSTRTTAEVQVYLAQQGLAGQFVIIAGSDTTERIKPHPQPILWAAGRLGIAPKNVVMVGDTEADVRSAQAAGALAVGVLCGFGDRADLKQADLVLAGTAELAEWL
jgi:phosphoglycolate phosphatase-like HAD superfamily hydrolase